MLVYPRGLEIFFLFFFLEIFNIQTKRKETKKKKNEWKICQDRSHGQKINNK